MTKDQAPSLLQYIGFLEETGMLYSGGPRELEMGGVGLLVWVWGHACPENVENQINTDSAFWLLLVHFSWSSYGGFCTFCTYWEAANSTFGVIVILVPTDGTDDLHVLVRSIKTSQRKAEWCIYARKVASGYLLALNCDNQ